MRAVKRGNARNHRAGNSRGRYLYCTVFLYQGLLRVLVVHAVALKTGLFTGITAVFVLILSRGIVMGCLALVWWPERPSHNSLQAMSSYSNTCHYEVHSYQLIEATWLQAISARQQTTTHLDSTNKYSHE